MKIKRQSPQLFAVKPLPGAGVSGFESSNPLWAARQSGLRGFISPLGRIAGIPAGYAGGSQSLVGNFPYFGPCGADFGRRSLVAIFQFPFRRGGDRFDCRQRPVRRGPLGKSGGRRQEVHSFGRLFGRHAMRFLSGKAVFGWAFVSIASPRPMTPGMSR